MSYPKLTNDEILTMTEFFRFVDSDNDGFITIQEIKMACSVDINQDGVISEEEITQCARGWVNDYLSQQDRDNDGKVTLHELLQFNNDTKN